MRIACVNRRVGVLAASLVLLVTLSLGGCAASNVGSSLMDARAEALAPPKTTRYPAVQNLPPKHGMMTADEQSKLKRELAVARDQQAASVKAQAAAESTKPKKHGPVQPTNQAVRP